MKKISWLLALIACVLFSGQANAQKEIENVNYYKYIVIPVQYKFQDEENKYLLNSLTKHLFKEEGYITYMDVEKKAKDLAFNKCLALYAEVESESESFFSLHTKLKLVLKDCDNKVIYETEGRSKIKTYKDAYQEALKEAFVPFTSFNYQYNGKNSYDNTSLYEEETTETVEVEEKVEPSLDEKLLGNYSLFNEEYIITKIEAGYVLTHSVTGNKKAFINVTSNNSILFNSDTINGSVTINEKEDLEIEYFNKNSGELEKVTLYKLK